MKMLINNVDKSNMATFAEVIASKQTDGPNIEGEISSVNPIFVLEYDLFGNINPKQLTIYLMKKYTKMQTAICLRGLQNVSGLWRLYLDNEEDRDKLLIEGLAIRKITHKALC